MTLDGRREEYADWIATKGIGREFTGLDHEPAAHLFDFQADLVRWAIRRGRAALFADTGLGKTAMQIEWARAIVASGAGRVIILAPLAVADQTVREAARFGVDVRYRRSDHGDPITIANYEMLDHFDADYAGVVLDESSILKSFNGSTRMALIDRFQATPYRMACTATPAPNDFTELGNHSEFLGIKPRTEMLAEYFVHDGGSTQDWRLKGHAQSAFWKWVSSWGAMVKAPSDLGYDDDRYVLPPLRMHEQVVPIDHRAAWSEGYLFAPDARTLSDQRAVRRATMSSRVTIAAEIAARPGPCLVWAETNAEADAATKAIDDAVQVAGRHSPEVKRDRLLGFADGRYRVLVTKAAIAGFGMNWQQCSRMVFMGASHSFERTYQAVRRCWRFGQTRAVDVYVIRAESEQAVAANFARKEADAARMAAALGSEVKAALRANVRGGCREWNIYDPTKPIIIPPWMQEAHPCMY